MLEIITNPGASASALTIKTTEIFPEAKVQGRLGIFVTFLNIPGGGREVTERSRSKVYTYHTRCA